MCPRINQISAGRCSRSFLLKMHRRFFVQLFCLGTRPYVLIKRLVPEVVLLARWPSGLFPQKVRCSDLG